MDGGVLHLFLSKEKDIRKQVRDFIDILKCETANFHTRTHKYIYIYKNRNNLQFNLVRVLL